MSVVRKLHSLRNGRVNTTITLHAIEKLSDLYAAVNACLSANEKDDELQECLEAAALAFKEFKRLDQLSRDFLRPLSDALVVVCEDALPRVFRSLDTIESRKSFDLFASIWLWPSFLDIHFSLPRSET